MAKEDNTREYTVHVILGDSIKTYIVIADNVMISEGCISFLLGKENVAIFPARRTVIAKIEKLRI